jgi:asparagine synthase (glutamine-hydrolysing)
LTAVGGIFRFDRAAVNSADLERMASALRSHGPDRSQTLVVGNTGLLNVLMRMTPEDLFDRQPFRGESGAIITADLRLDNREDILARFNISSYEALDWPDSRIVLTAWEKVGDNVWPLLRGPFAVAILGADRGSLTLARDHLGLNVVMWHKTDKTFAFATMPKGLFALPEVTRELNEEKIADFLVLNHAELATTQYKSIYRILPAHVARISADGLMTQRCYWSVADISPVRRRTDDDYASGLRECLDKAVRRQLRSLHPIGCFLSGGLDSSAVAMLAARALAEKGQRLSTYTQVPRAGFDGAVWVGRYADETPYVEAIGNAAPNIDVKLCHNDECDDLVNLDRFHIAFEGPVRNPTNLGWILTILLSAKADKRRVMLTGDHGNYTISWPGWTQAVDHLLDRNLVEAYRQWRQYYDSYNVSAWRAFRILFLDPLLPDWFGLRKFRRRHPACVGRWQPYSAILPTFALAAGVDARAQALHHDFLYRVRPGERALSLNSVDYVGDWNAAAKAFAGVEIRDPTADVDVVSFCFGVPSEQALAEGVDRSLIRRAMWGIVPSVVLTNTRRGLQSADWYEKWGRRREQLAEEIAALARSPLARRTLDLDRLNRALSNWPAGGRDNHETIWEYERAFTRGVATGRFLRWFQNTNSSN